METEWAERLTLISEAFSPSAPINSRDLFQGRQEILMDLHTTILSKGEHAIIHGDRGVGKTSLANIMDERYTKAKTIKFTCNFDSSLTGMWSSIFRRIEVGSTTFRQAGFTAEEQSQSPIYLMDIVKKETLNLDDIYMILDQLSTIPERVLIIIDEFDQVSSPELRRSIANIIKYLSDNVQNITMLLVGIGFTVSDLLIEHQSISRCLRQIKLERMSTLELTKILTNAEKIIGLELNKQVTKKIIDYSSGFPHFTHLLGKYIFLDAISTRNLNINIGNCTRGMIRALKNIDEGMKNSYQQAIFSNREALYEDVLIACAFARLDEQSSFRASDLKRSFREKLSQERKQESYQYHLGKLTSVERGSILESIPGVGNRKKYRFSSPLMKAYIRMKYHEKIGTL